MARINQEAILRLLLLAPMTCQWLLVASASFPKPYHSLSRVREVMQHLHELGLVGRAPMQELHQGQRRWLYFLKPAARRLLPELEGLRSSSGVFHPPLDPRAHALAIAEFVAHLHRSLGQSKRRVQLLCGLRDGSLRARVQVEEGPRALVWVIPDYTLLIQIDGQPQLLFLELQNRGAVLMPGAPQSVARSFAFKLKKYKALLREFHQHPLIASMLEIFGPVPGFRVLVVSTRSQVNLDHLRRCAQAHRKLFYFCRLADLLSANLFLDPIWVLPQGKLRAITDEPCLDQGSAQGQV